MDEVRIDGENGNARVGRAAARWQRRDTRARVWLGSTRAWLTRIAAPPET